MVVNKISGQFPDGSEVCNRTAAALAVRVVDDIIADKISGNAIDVSGNDGSQAAVDQSAAEYA